MSEAQRQRIGWWVDLVWKFGTPLALAALFFLKSAFATKDDLTALENRLTKTETAILLITKDAEVNQRQDKSLEDHEQRIRVLERVRPSFGAMTGASVPSAAPR
jgi:type II secretory pathway component PulJ